MRELEKMGGEEDSKKDGKEIGSGMGGAGIPASPKSGSEDHRSSQGGGKRTSAKGRKGTLVFFLAGTSPPGRKLVIQAEQAHLPVAKLQMDVISFPDSRARRAAGRT